MEDSADEQKLYVEKCLSREMVKNDIWYVISNKWYTSWKIYVRFQEMGDECVPNKPGVIDNSDILDDKMELKDGLAVGNEIDVVPEDVLKYLSRIYGFQPNNCEDRLKRSVIQLPSEELRVEIYPLKLKLLNGKSNKVVTETLSETATIGNLKNLMMKKFTLNNFEKYKLSMKDEEKWKPIEEKDDEPLAKLSLKSGQEISIDTHSQNGPMYTRSSYGRENTGAGICGLSNLGNTCFMNSALQCMSNVPHLTHFFLETDWKQDINKTNPIGMRGELAQAFAQLIRSVWSGDMPVYSPRDLKYNISRYAPQFSGYSQHDAHELLVFLLDGLHEDLNRIKKKPYIEFDDVDDRPDEIVAKDTWEKYKLRNDSIIYDTFYGLLKSTVTCPDCKFVSVTFDPFSTLSLPLPNDCEFFKNVVFYPEGWPLNSALSLKVKLVKGGSMRSLSKAVASLLEKDGLKLMPERIHAVKYGRVLSPDEYINSISDDVNLNVYEFDKEEKTLINVTVNFSDKAENFQIVVPQEVDYNKLALCLKPFFNPQIWQLSNSSENGCVNGDLKMGESLIDSLILAELFEIKLKERYSSLERSIKRDAKIGIKFQDASQLILTSHAVKSDQLKSTVLRDIKQHESMKTSKSRVTLDDCLRLFTTEEKLGNRDLWYCRKCKGEKAAYKKFELWNLPDVVIIHLKRFYFRTYRREKINTEVWYPTRNLNLHSWAPHMDARKCEYDLVAVSNHMGGMGGGHYTAYAKNKINDRWYLFDDSSTHEISEKNIVTSSAYLLVYVRKSSIDSEAMEVS